MVSGCFLWGCFILGIDSLTHPHVPTEIPAFSEESTCCKQASTKTAVFPMPDFASRQKLGELHGA
jgi:hypothetical protein